MARLETYETNPNPNPSSQTQLAEAARKTFKKAVEQRDTNETANKLAEHFEETCLEEEDKGSIKSTEDLNEVANTVTEDLQFGTNSALYTTAIADFIEREFQPTLLDAGVINRIQLPEQGKDSIKIPKQPDLQTAATVASDGTLTDDSTDYGQLEISTDFVGLVSQMTVELLRNANVDLMEDQLRQITNAIERKVDADIIAEIEAASTKGDAEYGDNSNYNYLGVGNEATYDSVVTAFYDAHANNANPDMFVASPEFLRSLFTNADMKDAVAFGTVSQSGDSANVVPQVQSILGFPVMLADQMSATRGHWIDSDRLGYLVEKTGVETMDQQLDGKAAFEVKAVKGYGVGVTKPQAVFSVIEDTDEPA